VRTRRAGIIAGLVAALAATAVPVPSSADPAPAGLQQVMPDRGPGDLPPGPSAPWPERSTRDGTVQGGPTLEDFGYRNRTVGGVLPLGTRPLLVLVAQFVGIGSATHTPSYFDSLIFPIDGPLTVNGYYQENSNGRFHWSRPSFGIVGPVTFPVQDTSYKFHDPAGISYFFKEIIRRTGTDLSVFDVNHDGNIAEEELAILILNNEGDGRGGAARAIDPSGCVQLTSPNLTVCGGATRVTTVGHLASFMTLCHELMHSLGAYDLYGPTDMNQSITLMGATIYSNPDDRRTYHLDPWHKMQYGWLEPRIRSLPAGGIESLPAAQLGQSDGPLILHDPARGPEEFFMIEYRSWFLSNPIGGSYDANTTGAGFAIWHIEQDANHDLKYLTPQIFTAFAEGSPDLSQGGNTLWSGPNATPPLRWNDMTQTATRLVARPFSIGVSTIEVEWLTDKEVWVDFNANPILQFGTFELPYRLLETGLAATPRGGKLRIKAGSTSEIATFDKPMRVEGYGGVVTIGQ
jgi:M6 family metalloprotease-like protein